MPAADADAIDEALTQLRTTLKMLDQEFTGEIKASPARLVEHIGQMDASLSAAEDRIARWRAVNEP